ncbi:MAG: TadE/TadG family type IV pilus assembly protein [Pseudomonadota bacterium]
MRFSDRLKSYGRNESGATLVEFALVLPMLLLVFAVIVEGGRLFWSYQAAISGVRDAARYLARVAPGDICGSGGSVAGYQSTLEGIVRNRSNGSAIFPSGVTVTSVVPSHACITGSYRGGQVPVATVTANLQVTFPFADTFALFGSPALATITTTVTDQNRIFGT